MNNVITKRTFIFVRHGEAEGNVKALCQGKIDFPLTEVGKRQGFEAAERLINFRGIPKIFSSDLSRAFDTAKIIADYLSCRRIIKLAGLQERGWGELDGKSNVLMFEHEELERNPNYVEPSSIQGLEEPSVFLKRISITMNEILSDCEVDVPIIVSHGRFFRSLCSLMGTEPIKQIPNAVPLRCLIENDEWRVEIL